MTKWVFLFLKIAPPPLKGALKEGKIWFFPLSVQKKNKEKYMAKKKLVKTNPPPSVPQNCEKKFFLKQEKIFGKN